MLTTSDYGNITDVSRTCLSIGIRLPDMLRQDQKTRKRHVDVTLLTRDQQTAFLSP